MVDSPTHGWRDGLVKEAIANLCNAKSFAKKLEHYPLTLQDLSPWCLDNLLRPCLSNIRTKSIFWLGQSGIGKTPASCAVASVISWFWQVQEGHQDGVDGPLPVFKMGSSLDYFKGEGGRKDCPYIYDDGTMAKNEVDHLKSFFDVLAEDAKVYARWGASSFGKGQHRQACSNRWTKAAELRAIDMGEHISHEVFMDILAPNFPRDVDPEDTVAVVKWANVIILGENAWHEAPAGCSLLLRSSWVATGTASWSMSYLAKCREVEAKALPVPKTSFKLPAPPSSSTANDPFAIDAHRAL
eukprot:6468380-Amphidinium_carterae.2